ncbi:MAG: hypothetical protein P8080_10465 [Gammaproteobacteria bacterium]
MKIKTLGMMTLIGAALAVLCMPAHAQVTRESGTKSIAGVLHDTYNTQDSFGFFSQGGEILFADIDADIFQTNGRMGGDHDDTSHTDSHTDEGGAPAEPGPGEHEDHEEGDGCADGGPGGICLQVYDRTMGEVICHAGRPMRPGWQRDPALACPLPARKSNGEYILAVKLGGCGGGYTPPEADVPFDVNGPGTTTYVLNYSLRGMASDGHLEAQAAKSGF